MAGRKQSAKLSNRKPESTECNWFSDFTSSNAIIEIAERMKEMKTISSYLAEICCKDPCEFSMKRGNVPGSVCADLQAVERISGETKRKLSISMDVYSCT